MRRVYALTKKRARRRWGGPQRGARRFLFVYTTRDDERREVCIRAVRSQLFGTTATGPALQTLGQPYVGPCGFRQPRDLHCTSTAWSTTSQCERASCIRKEAARTRTTCACCCFFGLKAQQKASEPHNPSDIVGAHWAPLLSGARLITPGRGSPPARRPPARSLPRSSAAKRCPIW